MPSKQRKQKKKQPKNNVPRSKPRGRMQYRPRNVRGNANNNNSVPAAYSTPIRGGPALLNPRTRQRNNVTVIDHAEYVGALTFTGEDDVHTLILNAANSTLFPWLSSIAKCYEYYRFTKLVFEITSLMPTLTPGRSYATFDYDSIDSAFADRTALMNYGEANSVSIWQPKLLLPARKQIKWLYTLAGDQPSQSDIRLYNYGNFNYLFTGETLLTGNKVADLRVFYEVELKVAKLPLLGAIPPPEQNAPPLISCFKWGPQNQVTGANPLWFFYKVFENKGIVITKFNTNTFDVKIEDWSAYNDIDDPVIVIDVLATGYNSGFDGSGFGDLMPLVDPVALGDAASWCEFKVAGFPLTDDVSLGTGYATNKSTSDYDANKIYAWRRYRSSSTVPEGADPDVTFRLSFTDTAVAVPAQDTKYTSQIMVLVYAATDDMAPITDLSLRYGGDRLRATEPDVQEVEGKFVDVRLDDHTPASFPIEMKHNIIHEDIEPPVIPVVKRVIVKQPLSRQPHGLNRASLPLCKRNLRKPVAVARKSMNKL